jgi:hypothetical protein
MNRIAPVHRIGISFQQRPAVFQALGGKPVVERQPNGPAQPGFGHRLPGRAAQLDRPIKQADRLRSLLQILLDLGQRGQRLDVIGRALQIGLHTRLMAPQIVGALRQRGLCALQSGKLGGRNAARRDQRIDRAGLGGKIVAADCNRECLVGDQKAGIIAIGGRLRGRQRRLRRRPVPGLHRCRQRRQGRPFGPCSAAAANWSPG